MQEALTIVPKSWRQQSTGMKVLFATVLLASGLVMTCWSVAFYIETTALRQPSIADSVFRHPRRLKGVVRYLNDQQESIYSVTKPIMFPSLVITCVLGGIWNWLVRRQVDEIKRDKLNHILG